LLGSVCNAFSHFTEFGGGFSAKDLEFAALYAQPRVVPSQVLTRLRIERQNMGTKLCILGSGSRGNCTFVSAAGTNVLIDAGLSGKETLRRLGQIDESVENIDAVCLSHEHNDHIVGLPVLHRKHGVPIFANAGTIEGVVRDERYRGMQWDVFTTGHAFAIGNMTVETFSVPHDAYDPVGFVVHAAGRKIGIVTDVGMVTNVIRERLKDCHAVIVESNHDEGLLQAAPRPWSLKQRIRSRQGHLSNAHAAKILVDIAGPELRQVFLAHLSEDCNRQDLALRTMCDSLEAAGRSQVNVSLAFPDRVSDVWRH
jgi:phosphoribosyl 1,2-cyclic phosphodiesterase